MDNQFIWNWVLTIGVSICGGFIALGKRLLSQAQENFAKQIAQHDEQVLRITTKLDDNKNDLHDFKLYVRDNFVSKDDYLHSIEKLDAKMDMIRSDLHNIDKTTTHLAAIQGVTMDE